MSKFKQSIKLDLVRLAGGASVKVFIYYFFRTPTFRFQLWLRALQTLQKWHPLYILAFLAYVRMSFKFGFQIPYQTVIGEGLYIGHFGTIVVNRYAVIGRNCNLTHNVTIGQANRGARKGAPTLGDRVWIGTGAVVVGKITIGDNVLIAPNAYVNFDVPSNSLVIGNPATIIEKTSSIVDGYIQNAI